MRKCDPMRALIFDREMPCGVRLGDAPEPIPEASQALVRVAATSLNFGEVAFMRDHRFPGAIPGWDAAGVVITPAADGSGPAAGARVATFGGSGGWAELRAVDATELAAIPDSVDVAVAAALPVAGVTALRALRRLGSVVGCRVLITGASGGVGRFAVQLAALSGAHVIACVGRPERAVGLEALGAAEVVIGLDNASGQVQGVLDNVGGPILAQAFSLLKPGGLAVNIGMASLQPTSIDFEQARLRGGGTRIEAFSMGKEVGRDLAYLLELVKADKLDPQIGWRGGWEQVGDAVAALVGRRVLGKAILEVRHGSPSEERVRRVPRRIR
jgi:NADPH:quinone reductase-like Zn-dependent oxidoreductase